MKHPRFHTKKLSEKKLSEKGNIGWTFGNGSGFIKGEKALPKFFTIYYGDTSYQNRKKKQNKMEF